VPAWFNEGLAEYYSTFDIDDARKVYLGKPITNHILLLRDAKPLPLKTLFAVDHYSLERNKHDTRSIFYAQSWALVHYLIQGNEGKRLANFGKFLDLLVNNTSVETAFRDAFQMDYATLEKELRSYVQKKSFRMDIATFEKKLEFDTEMTATPITEAEAQAYLGDLLYHTNRADEAIAKLEGVLALDPDLSMARSSLGLALTRKKDFAKAKEHLARAAGGNSTNYLAHYYYAFVLSREGMDERDYVTGYSNETAALMRSELAKAIQLKPDFPESYHLMAFVNLVMNEKLDDALNMINKAVALSPGSEEYLFVLSQIYARQQNFAAALKIIERLAGSSSDPTIRATAENYLNSIKNAQEQMAQFEQQRAERASHRQSQTPPATVELTTVEQNPFAYLEDALRKPGSDEKRMQGFLTSIECSAKGVVLLVEADGRVWRFGAKDFEGIDITTFTPDVNGELKCGARTAREWVVLTFKPAADAKTKNDGMPVGLEFVPTDFKLSSN
jgi:tetratricopeptide (TPR) repeat protein